METCLNCGTELKGKYCCNCGQAKITKRMNVKSLFHDFLHSYFHWESSLIITIKELAIAPGNFIHSYIEGKRKSYTAPVSFFILTTTIFVIMFHFVSENFLNNMNHMIIGESVDKISIRGETPFEIQHFIANKINYFLFLLPPVIAFYFMLVFRKMKINFAEALVFSFYMMGQGMLMSSILILTVMLSFKLSNLRYIVTVSYYIFAMVQFSRSNVFPGILKSAAVLILSYLSFFLIMVSLLITFLKFII